MKIYKILKIHIRIGGSMMNVINSSEELKKLINENEILLVYFGNTTCGVCVDMKPKVELMLSKYPNIESAYVEVEKLFKLASQYSMFTVPGVIVFIEGKESIREARNISIRELDTKLDRYYNLLFG